MSKKDQRSPELLEFEAKFQANTKYSGFGMATTLHVPCAFCAEPDFMVYKILEVDEAVKKGAVCKSCLRGLKAIFHVDTPGNKQFEMVQFCGPEAPRFLTPIRRIDCAECDDTHKITLRDPHGGDYLVSCTSCPTPCSKCSEAQGVFCAGSPCPCVCHKEKNSGSS